jgi:hypothetical protein
MVDATDILNRYREVSRLLWNNFFLPRRPDFDDVKAFDRIGKVLFAELVLRELSPEEAERGERRGGPLWVVPDADRIPIMVNRPSPDGNLYWDDPTMSSIDKRGADLAFIDCFDWDLFGYRELHYFRVRIVRCPTSPALQGREALLEAYQVRVYFGEEPPKL